MFYIVSTATDSIIVIASTRPTLHTLEQLAQETCLDLYVIEGERAGIEYNRPERIVHPARKPVVSTAKVTMTNPTTCLTTTEKE